MPRNSARYFDIAWMRETIAACRAAKVPCFCKQLGANCEVPLHDDFSQRLRDRKGGDPLEWPTDLRVREWPKATP